MPEDITVVDRPAAHRYEVSVAGELAGFTEYHLHGGIMALIHTEVGPQFAGRGIGATLVRYALDDARHRKLAVQPFCPFVRRYIATHPEYLDLVPEDQRPRFDL